MNNNFYGADRIMALLNESETYEEGFKRANDARQSNGQGGGDEHLNEAVILAEAMETYEDIEPEPSTTIHKFGKEGCDEEDGCGEEIPDDIEINEDNLLGENEYLYLEGEDMSKDDDKQDKKSKKKKEDDDDDNDLEISEDELDAETYETETENESKSKSKSKKKKDDDKDDDDEDEEEDDDDEDDDDEDEEEDDDDEDDKKSKKSKKSEKLSESYMYMLQENNFPMERIIPQTLTWDERAVRLAEGNDGYYVTDYDVLKVCEHYDFNMDLPQVVELIAESHNISTEDLFIITESEGRQLVDIKEKATDVIRKSKGVFGKATKNVSTITGKFKKKKKKAKSKSKIFN